MGRDARATQEALTRLDERIAERRAAGRYLVSTQARYGGDDLERRRAEALADALYQRGATSIMADADDFPSGGIEPDDALRAEADAFARSMTQPALVVRAFTTNMDEAPAALETLGRQRAQRVHDYLAAAGMGLGRMRVASVGAADPAAEPGANRWAEIAVGAPSGW